MSTAVDKLIAASKWSKELEQLRKIILECDVEEEIKWGQPCYTSNGKNIVIIGALKASAVIGFFKGSHLSDPKKILKFPGKNTQSAKSIYFTSVDEIVKLKTVLKQYVKEAIEVEKAGLKHTFRPR